MTDGQRAPKICGSEIRDHLDSNAGIQTRFLSTVNVVNRAETYAGRVGAACWLVTEYMTHTEKTELLWAGSRHGQSSVTDCRPYLQLGADTVTAQDDVRLL